MSKRRVPGAKSKTRRSRGPIERARDEFASNLQDDKHKVERFIGISLSGGKSDKACVAVVEHYPVQGKVFLARIFEKIKTEEFISADLKIHEIVNQYHRDVKSVAIDAPLSLPHCATCKLKCPGYESCSVDEMRWMRNHYGEVNKDKKPRKMFTPYTQRCVDAYISHSLEESFEMHHALGANLAPLTMRALFIKRRLSLPTLEVFPKLTVWRLGKEMKLSPSHIKFHRHSVGGDESRKVFLQALSDKKGIFIYQQDMKAMVENNHAFEAFVCAYTGLLDSQNLCEERPKGFPKDEPWIAFPKT